jgi:Fic family protein
MRTLRLLSYEGLQVPAATAWYLADLGEARGKQDLFTQQVPQRLRALREHALIESAVSSNRIEGVEIDPMRARPLVVGGAMYRDRSEEEVRGYRDALKIVHEGGLHVSETMILELHRLTRGEIWDAGKYKERDSDIIERSATGEERVRFRPVSSTDTPAAMRALLGEWQNLIEERRVHPLLLAAAFNLDFLCIHPFRDGNGRVSRLLLLSQCHLLGYEVGRYISLERLIEQNKARYYETLEQSSRRWHEGRHDPWHFINYVLYVLKSAYREFEDRVGDVKVPRGTKTELVLGAIARSGDAVTLAELERSCPGVSREMLRRVLRHERTAGRLVAEGRGPGARWRKKG